MATSLLFRLGLIRAVGLWLVGVLLLTPKDTKNLLQWVLFLVLFFLVLGVLHLYGRLALSSGIRRTIRIIGHVGIGVWHGLPVCIRLRLLGLSAAEYVRKPRTRSRKNIVRTMNLAVLSGSRPGNEHFQPGCRAIGCGQLQRLGIDQYRVNPFRRIKILHVA